MISQISAEPKSVQLFSFDNDNKQQYQKNLDTIRQIFNDLDAEIKDKNSFALLIGKVFTSKHKISAADKRISAVFARTGRRQIEAELKESDEEVILEDAAELIRFWNRAYKGDQELHQTTMGIIQRYTKITAVSTIQSQTELKNAAAIAMPDKALVEMAAKIAHLENLNEEQNRLMAKALALFSEVAEIFKTYVDKTKRLEPDFLMKTCLACHNLFNKFKAIGSLAEGAHITTEAQEEFLVRIKDNQLHIIDIGTGKLKHTGCWSQLYEVTELIANEAWIAKIGTDCIGDKFSKGDTLLNESHNLAEIARRGLNLYQPKPLLTVDTRKTEANQKVGDVFMICKIFKLPYEDNGDLFNWAKSMDNKMEVLGLAKCKKEFVNFIKQIWQQWEDLLDFDIYHGDIKPENFLTDGKVCVLGDFATANLNIFDNFNVPLCSTKEFTPINFQNALQRKQISAGISHDRFGIASCLYGALTGNASPYDIKEGRPAGIVDIEFIQRFCREEFASIIKQMLSLTLPANEGALIRQNRSLRASFATVAKGDLFFKMC